MKILWLTWKDRRHPQAGGAEVVNEELAKRLAAAGDEVVFVVAGFAGCAQKEERDGFSIVRLGGRYSVYWKAYRYYKKHLKQWPDLVIDEMNTIPFFATWYTTQPTILFVHQLCREIWFYQMFFPLNVVGYLLEPVYLWLLRNMKVVTISESTKKDLVRFGFTEKNVHIISEGIELEPVQDISNIEKFSTPTVLALGAVRPMKRTDQVVRAFALLKQKIPNAKLTLAGATEGRYGEKVLKLIQESPYVKDIECLGRVSSEKKIELMQKAHVLAVTSLKEGWGLVVTEANSQGTPAVVYNADGLRDSVQNGKTGLIVEQNTPQGLADKLAEILQNKSQYDLLRKNAWKWSKEINFDASFQQFEKILHHA